MGSSDQESEPSERRRTLDDVARARDDAGRLPPLPAHQPTFPSERRYAKAWPYVVLGAAAAACGVAWVSAVWWREIQYEEESALRDVLERIYFFSFLTGCFVGLASAVTAWALPPVARSTVFWVSLLTAFMTLLSTGATS